MDVNWGDGTSLTTPSSRKLPLLLTECVFVARIKEYVCPIDQCFKKCLISIFDPRDIVMFNKWVYAFHEEKRLNRKENLVYKVITLL